MMAFSVRAVAVPVLGILRLLILLTHPASADPPDPDDLARQKVAQQVWEALDPSTPGGPISVIVTMRDQPTPGKPVGANREERVRRVATTLQARAKATQGQLLAFLDRKRREGAAVQATSFWVFNGLALTADRAVIRELARRSDVLRITPNEYIPAPSIAASSSIEPNISKINAPALWDLGYRGQGVVVANLDTGVDLNHPDLVNQWRGGANSWYDPNGEHPYTPTDLNGHGTLTMSLMVGRNAGGTAIGVAPDAQWIAVKIFNDQGYATTAGIHAGFQWLLDPDGDPATADAPHVVNSSWDYQSPGCNLGFQLDLQALRAAGILPIFSAGNAGPEGSTSLSPANNPAAFAVGAIDASDGIFIFSSRGPSRCGETDKIFPEMVAPGVSIRSGDRDGLYREATGTSLSAPHVSGGLALLLSAYPGLAVADQERALIGGAVDLGPAGPDNDFGNGRLNVLEAYRFLQASAGVPTLTATATATSESPTVAPTPTATVTPTATPDSPPLDFGRLVNGGFEMGLEGWYRPPWFAGAVAVSGAESHSGDAAMRFQGKGSGLYVQQDVPAAPGERFDLGGWISVPQHSGTMAAEVELVARHQYNYDLKSYPVAIVASATSGWVRFSGSAVMPDRTSTLRLRVHFPSLNGTAYLDDLSLHVAGDQGSSPTPTPTPTATAPTPTPMPPTSTATPLPPTPTLTPTAVPPTYTPTAIAQPLTPTSVPVGFQPKTLSWWLANSGLLKPLLPIAVYGNVVASQDWQAIRYLKDDSSTDASKALFAQLLATKLNMAAGAVHSCVDAVVANAEALLMAHPYASNPLGTDRATALELRDQLIAYNGDGCP